MMWCLNLNTEAAQAGPILISEDDDVTPRYFCISSVMPHQITAAI